MKNNTTHLILGVMLFLFCGACAHYTDNTSVTKIYRYVNDSGVEVALVGKANGYYDIPDSLVLQNGESYECSNTYGFMNENQETAFPYKDGKPGAFIPIKIYFNKIIYLSYYINEYIKRNPFFTDDFYVKTTREEKNKKFIKIINTYTYTFTAADYQNALKAQK